MPSDQLKLTYFDAQGRAEHIRLALAIGHIEYTDHRFAFSDFDSIKPDTPYRAVPTLTIDGEVYAQSDAILRYVGKKTGLYPSNDMDALKVDEINDTITDLFQAIYRCFGDEEEKKRADREKMMKEEFPRFAGGMEKRLEVFSDGPYVLGEDVSVADCSLVTLVNRFHCGALDYVPKDALDKFPRIMKVYENAMKLPEVVEWYKKRPIAGVTN